MGKLFNVKFDGDARIETLPKTILEEQCIYLNEETNGIIIGRVAEYIGNIKSYYTIPATTSLKNFLGVDQSTISEIGRAFTPQKTDIQEVLGEVGEEQFTYEFFLTSRGTPDYKFRVMFLQYDITGYPATIVLEEGIALEINSPAEQGYIYLTHKQNEFEKIIAKIFTSRRFGDIVRKLVQLNNS